MPSLRRRGGREEDDVMTRRGRGRGSGGGEVLKDRRSPRRRGRTGTSV
jgi:hypothetical protein